LIDLIGFSMQFNARSESVKEKASFRRLIPKNRCLVAVEGYGNMADAGLCNFY
jgi:putative SOS response-associated peptidase YedK